MARNVDIANASAAASHAWEMEGAPGAETLLNGRRYLYFAGTGYLGLQGHPALIAAASEAVQKYGIHAATSRAGYGTSPPVREVERRAARFLGADEAAYLVSGYAGNFAVMSALSDQATLALVDEASHHSLVEATRMLAGLSQPAIVFRHRDAGHLDELLHVHARAGSRPLVLTDGVFALSGRVAPLADYLSVLAKYDGAMLYLDDAHALAVLGQCGRGSLELAGVAATAINRDPSEAAAGPRVFHSATLSKAVGGHGGIVAGTTDFMARLRRASGWFRGASAPAASVAAATAKGLELIEADPTLRTRLASNVGQLRHALRNLGLDVEVSGAPIIGLQLTTAAAMQRVQQRLADEGILIAYTRDYAGAGRDGMLRIAVFATHTNEQIARLVDALRRALAEETGAE
ncbi:MAG: aminotransferase class I/II-fold pyridoxal phosphate-dependent enzyme [Pirellulales bacterium]